MARFLFTMLPFNDLGLPTRMLPIARALADRGHDVALFNPAPAPAKLIADAGLTNLRMPACPAPLPEADLGQVCSAWDLDHLLGAFYTTEEFVRGMTPVYLAVIRDYNPDIVVDSFDLLACLAARILRLPLASVLQSNFHPASHGFLWWQSERPAGLPNAVALVNKLAAENGLPLQSRCVDLLAGDLSLIVGTPETDPLPEDAHVHYIGPVVWQRGDAVLPDWVTALPHDQPLIWLYPGNPRYFDVPTPGDSIVVTRAAIAAFADEPVQVVLTTGFQDLPAELGTLPPNFHHAAYVPGLAMAERCELLVHHGGYSSVMTGLMAGKPAVMIPTITERESNARRLASLGAGEVVLPVNRADGEKEVDVEDFRSRVQKVLREPGYRRSAQRIAESMKKYGGVSEAADRLERFATESKL